MAFIQIIECRTSNMDEIRKLDQEWEKATEGRRTLQRSIITQDRNDPNRYLVLAFFDAYESAMENSKLPETEAFAEKLGALMDAPPMFHDLDVVDDRS
jgi:quinol monooxygenase YgiN